MLAIKLHRNPRPALAKGDWLIPILDWKSGQMQVPPNPPVYAEISIYHFGGGHPRPSWPVSLLIRYGDSNYIKAIYLIDDFKPLRDYDQRLKQGILESSNVPGHPRAGRIPGWSRAG